MMIADYDARHRNSFFATDPTDWQMAEQGLKMIYRAARLRLPSQIIRCKSPLEGYTYVNDALVGRLTDDEVDRRVGSAVWIRTARKLRAATGAAVAMAPQLNLRCRPNYTSIADHILHNVSDTARCRPIVWSQMSYGNQEHDIINLSLLPRREGRVFFDIEGLILMTESAGWFWLYDEVAVVCDRPSLFLMKDDTTFATIQYPDGWTVVNPCLTEVEVLAIAAAAEEQ